MWEKGYRCLSKQTGNDCRCTGCYNKDVIIKLNRIFSLDFVNWVAVLLYEWKVAPSLSSVQLYVSDRITVALELPQGFPISHVSSAISAANILSISLHSLVLLSKPVCHSNNKNGKWCTSLPVYQPTH